MAPPPLSNPLHRLVRRHSVWNLAPCITVVRERALQSILKNLVGYYALRLQPYSALACFGRSLVWTSAEDLSKAERKNDLLSRYTSSSSSNIESKWTRRSWWSLYPFWASFEFLSASLHRLVAFLTSFILSFKDYAKSSSHTNERCLGTTSNTMDISVLLQYRDR